MTVQFSGEKLDLILDYQKAIEATSIENAILNAVSLALDHECDEKRLNEIIGFHASIEG